jgi:predicted TIM-barrel fold metal-dependent hydrolase
MNIAKTQPGRFAFLAGGDSLNPLIQTAVRTGQVSSDLQRQFEKKATEIMRAGAVGFGETTALHPSLNPTHPFEEAPPDHLLFLQLADLAARFDVPIDLHMEAMTRDTPTPEWLRQASPNNPAILKENITGLERLLAHNRQARIVWAHAGRDPIGQTTVALLRRLVEAHRNLYLQLALVPLGGPIRIFNRPMNSQGVILPEWLDLIRSFPDRFVLGSDAFYCEAEFKHTAANRPFLAQLPAELARQVAYENALRVYKLAL